MIFVTRLLRNALLLAAGTAGAATAQTLPAHGLAALYCNGETFEEAVVERTDAQLDFDWHQRPPATGVTAEHFSVRWTGFLEAPASGIYLLHLRADDGVRLWLGNRLLLEAWDDQYATELETRVHLEAGKVYALQVEYYQNALDSRLQLSWERPDISMQDFFGGQAAFEPIPTRYLWTALPMPSALLGDATIPAPILAPVPTAPSLLPLRPLAPAQPLPTRRTAPTVARAASATDTSRLAGLEHLRKGTVVPLPNLYFTQSTADLLPASRRVLDELTQVLRRQAALRLEIAGHTDNVGEAGLNLRLSEQRARVVRRYLVQQGIDSVRLLARGYGGARPVADNGDPQQRPRNRRVEVVVR